MSITITMSEPPVSSNFSRVTLVDVLLVLHFCWVFWGCGVLVLGFVEVLYIFVGFLGVRGVSFGFCGGFVDFLVV